GSFERDADDGEYPFVWDSFDDLEAWISAEESKNSIELLRKDSIPNKNKREREWLVRHVWVCARQGFGGKKKYTAKKPDQTRKIPNKRVASGCPCRLVVKSYVSTEKLRGRYEASHSHPIGSANLVYTRISNVVKNKIEDLLRQGVRPDIVVNIQYFRRDRAITDVVYVTASTRSWQ
ncbi:hypothetical protein DFH06DRAFT_1017888, partial [Mycena polygramma]